MPDQCELRFVVYALQYCTARVIPSPNDPTPGGFQSSFPYSFDYPFGDAFLS